MQKAKVQKTKPRNKKDKKVKAKKSVLRKKTGQERSTFKGMNSVKIHEIIF
ncbi:MAG: hypothetical protein IPL53_18630 [Ignavibacteria bacterium]|nr:hypothetical protein [Ignavibacteria bacterium]